ncbi:MAG: hypothetical protein AAB551_00200 [Patescibacteria group bacterium]
MNELSLEALAIAYAGTGVTGLVGYWPTIKDLYHHRKASANIPSYIIWTASSLIAFLYSLFILPDFLFIIVSGTHFVACAIVLILSINLKNDR